MTLASAPRRPKRTAPATRAGTSVGETASSRSGLRAGIRRVTNATREQDLTLSAPVAGSAPRSTGRAPRVLHLTLTGTRDRVRGHIALLRALFSRTRPDVLHLDIPAATTTSVLGSGLAARVADLVGIPAVVTAPSEALVDWFDKAPSATSTLARVWLTVDSARWVVAGDEARADLAERLLISPAHLRVGDAGQAYRDALAPARRWRDAGA